MAIPTGQVFTIIRQQFEQLSRYKGTGSGISCMQLVWDFHMFQKLRSPLKSLAPYSSPKTRAEQDIPHHDAAHGDKWCCSYVKSESAESTFAGF